MQGKRFGITEEKGKYARWWEPSPAQSTTLPCAGSGATNNSISQPQPFGDLWARCSQLAGIPASSWTANPPGRSVNHPASVDRIPVGQLASRKSIFPMWESNQIAGPGTSRADPLTWPATLHQSAPDARFQSTLQRALSLTTAGSKTRCVLSDHRMRSCTASRLGG